jgi:predicted RNA-binding protein with RPS1 domain
MNTSEPGLEVQAASSDTNPATPAPERAATGGPLNLEQIRRMREAQASKDAEQRSARSRPTASETAASDSSDRSSASKEDALPASSENAAAGAHAPAAGGEADEDQGGGKRRDKFRKGGRSREDADNSYSASSSFIAPKVTVPNLRQRSDELESELDAAMMDADLNGLMIGGADLAIGRAIEDGSRHRCRIIKIHQDSVFVSLGGPDEGVIPLLQFTDMPQVDQQVDCLVRSFNQEDGLYELAMPGEANNVDDWNDIQEGLIVEATVESSNTGGLECKVGAIRGFIPMRQISEFRVEDVSGYIGQRLLCVVMEANPRRGNLVLSHRAILERERREKRAERLANLEIGQATEGTVTKIMDFGAFVDIGGLEGLIHISQLSYERVKHPSEVVKEGDKIQVRVEKIDPDTGKIGLSYRNLQEHPWTNVETKFPVGAVVNGTVSRLANFGAFVKLATGVEGLIHISELSHGRAASVGSVVKEGQEVEVKILSVDQETQRIGLSLKATQAKPESAATKEKVKEDDVVEPPRKPVISKHQGPLKGGAATPNSGGEKFGLKW